MAAELSARSSSEMGMMVVADAFCAAKRQMTRAKRAPGRKERTVMCGTPGRGNVWEGVLGEDEFPLSTLRATSVKRSNGAKCRKTASDRDGWSSRTTTHRDRSPYRVYDAVRGLLSPPKRRRRA